MPEKENISLSKTSKTVSFLDTPKMSTYLLAFCVGEFDAVQAQTENGVLVKVYTPPGKSASGTFALDCAVKCLDYYDEFFGVPYPLPKLDMVAIPEFVSLLVCVLCLIVCVCVLIINMYCLETFYFILNFCVFVLLSFKGYGSYGKLGFGDIS